MAHFLYAHDYRNRLIEVGSDGGSGYSTLVIYEYDGLNRRVKKDLTSGTDVVYLYSGWRVIEERELDGAVWEARRQYVYGARYIDEPLIFDNDTNDDGVCHSPSGNTRYLYCQDANFNVVALTDDAGVIVEKTWYEPYGKATWYYSSSEQTSSSVDNPLLFQGRRWCTETSLYYFRNRDMSPTLGRFTSRDVVAYTDGYNAYETERSATVRWLDPEGYQAVKCCGPDVTTWFKTKLRVNSQDPVILELRKNVMKFFQMSGAQSYFPYEELGAAADLFGSLLKFKALVQRYGKWDFATTVSFKTGNCPSLPDCDLTVTLCDKCLMASTLGNIHYAFVGAAAALPRGFLKEQAAKRHPGGVDPQHARAEIDLGVDLWEGRNVLGPHMGPDVSRLCKH